MIFLEFSAIIIVAVILITVVISIGKPVAETLAQRTIFKYKELDSESAVKFQMRLSAVETELMQVRKQLEDLRAVTDFNTELLETSGLAGSNKIELTSRQEESVGKRKENS